MIKVFVCLIVLICSPALAAMKINADGTATFIADDRSVASVTTAPGQTQAQIDAAYAAYQNTWSIGFWEQQQLAALNAYFYTNYNFDTLIVSGTVSTLTAAQVSAFIAAVINNYRGIRAAINNAVTVPAVRAINVKAGWPANP